MWCESSALGTTTCLCRLIMCISTVLLIYSPVNEVLKQYNNLTASQRTAIKKQFSEYDDIRRQKIPKEENTYAWEIGIMVDANILACEYDVDPLTVVLCINPICRPNEKIMVR